MAYRVEIHATADDEIEQALLWIAAESPARALNWFDELLEIIGSLRQFPERCPIAPESKGRRKTIRQQLHGPYRILFRVTEHTVQVLHVIHGARQTMDEI